MLASLISFGLVITTIFCASVAPAVVIRPESTAWIRLPTTATQLKISPKGKFIAYVGDKQLGLSILDMATKRISVVTKQFVGSSFFWSPDGFRIVYREMGVNEDAKISSIIKVFDSKLNRSIVLNQFDYRTGLLTFDPRDFKFLLMHKTGLHAMHISFPDIRLARWQVAQKEDFGRWVAAQNGVLWLSNGGLSMEKMADDGSAIDSFDVSPDGKSVAWATEKGRVYTSREGAAPTLIGYGKDPDWHPKHNILLYSAFRMTGQTPTGSDLRVIDQDGRGRWVTQTQYSQERWPQWVRDGSGIIFTKDKTTDLYVMDFKS